MYAESDIGLKQFEHESFIKSFFLFFLSLGMLNTFLFIFEYHKRQNELDQKLLTQMKLCSFDLKCTQFDIDFAPLDAQNIYKLFKDESGLYSFFSIPKSETYALKLTLSQVQYERQVQAIRYQLITYYVAILFAIALISLLFSLYALYPLKRALRLTEEFSKDILHDFNTPLTSLRLNIRMLQCPKTEEKKLNRIEQSIETLLRLQANLRSYLEEHQLQQERFELKSLLDERVSLLQKIHPDIAFELSCGDVEIFANKDAFIRIIDNLLSNACKYNKANGDVLISFDPQSSLLEIKDTGKGIASPERAFERFYKEQERGVGIGLHIVKKLCDALGIAITLKSRLGVGTTFILDLSKLTLR